MGLTIETKTLETPKLVTLCDLSRIEVRRTRAATGRGFPVNPEASDDRELDVPYEKETPNSTTGYHVFPGREFSPHLPNDTGQVATC